MNIWESIDYVAQWARDRREALDLSQADVAARATELLHDTGGTRVLKQQSIDQLEKKAHKGVPDWFRFVREALDAFAEEAAPRKVIAPPKPKVLPDIPPPNVDDVEMIPEVDLRYAMGDGAVLADYPEVGQIPFNRQFRRSLTSAPVEKLFVARGDGDSMLPTLINDDMVLIDTSQNRITQSDRIWALAVGDAGMIKRVRVLGTDQYELHSDNPSIRPQPITREELTVVGRVIWVGRRI
ncbi:MAG: S24 family peptidase [Sphingomonas oligoaromativorans]